MNITSEAKEHNHEIHPEVLEIVRSGIPSEDEIADLADLFKIFGDSTRMKILYALFESELCVCDLSEAVNMTESAVSHQLRVLKQAKLIAGRRAGKQIFYRLADDHVSAIINQGREHIEE